MVRPESPPVPQQEEIPSNHNEDVQVAPLVEDIGAEETMAGLDGERDAHEMEDSNGTPRNESPCKSTYAGDAVFRFMELPAEIRNDIYRICLTRPYGILLTQRISPLASEAEAEPARRRPSRITPVVPNIGDGDGDIVATRSNSAAAGPVRTRTRPHCSRRIARDEPDPWLVAPRSLTGGDQQQQSHPRGLPRGNTFPSRLAAPNVVGRPRIPSSLQEHITPQGNSLKESALPRPQAEDPLSIDILRLSKQVYNEARAIMYSENHFTLDLLTALPSLGALHQRTRRQIRHVEFDIPCHNEITERFSETVRLSLRYCWGLKTITIGIPFILPGAAGSTTTGNTMLYANGFDILRWLPRQCEVILVGNVCTEIKAVVSKNANLAKTLDEVRSDDVQAFGSHYLLINRLSRAEGWVFHRTDPESRPQLAREAFQQDLRSSPHASSAFHQSVSFPIA